MTVTPAGPGRFVPAAVITRPLFTMAKHRQQRCTTATGSVAGTIFVFASTERSVCGTRLFSIVLMKTEANKTGDQFYAFNEGNQPQSPKSGGSRRRSSSTKTRRRRKDLLPDGVHAELHSRMGNRCFRGYCR